MDKYEKIGILLIILSISVAIVSYLILPDYVITQVGFDGKSSNTSPKIVALIFPLLCSLAGSIGYMINFQNRRNQYLILFLLGMLIYGLNLFFNH